MHPGARNVGEQLNPEALGSSWEPYRVVTYETSAVPEAVLSFYAGEMPKTGWAPLKELPEGYDPSLSEGEYLGFTYGERLSGGRQGGTTQGTNAVLVIARGSPGGQTQVEVRVIRLW